MPLKAKLVPALLVVCVLLMVHTANAVQTEIDGNSTVTTRLCSSPDDCVGPNLSGRCLPAKRCVCSSPQSVFVSGRCTPMASIDVSKTRMTAANQGVYDLTSITGEQYNCSQQASVCRNFDNSALDGCDEKTGLCRCEAGHFFVQGRCLSSQTALICRTVTAKSQPSQECMDIAEKIQGSSKIKDEGSDEKECSEKSDGPEQGRPKCKSPYPHIPISCLYTGLCECTSGLFYRVGKGCVNITATTTTATTTTPSVTAPSGKSGDEENSMSEKPREAPKSSVGAPAPRAVSVAAAVILSFLATWAI